MSAKQEQIELFVADATHSLGNVRRSLEVVALGNAELSSAVVGVARSLGETAARFELVEMAEICAVVTAEVPQVMMEEDLPQRERWEPLFVALQEAIDTVAAGRTPSVRGIVTAIAHLKGESVERGDELEASYAEMGLAEFALEENPFAGAAEPVTIGEGTAADRAWFESPSVEGGDWFAEESEQAFATAEDLFTDGADGLSDVEDWAIASAGGTEAEEGAGGSLFADSALFESFESIAPTVESGGFGLLGGLEEETMAEEQPASREAFAEVTALPESNLTSDESASGRAETLEPFEFDEGFLVSLTETPVSGGAPEEFEEFSDFGEVFGEPRAEGTEVATEAQATAEELPDLGGLFENSGEGRDREEPLAVVPEEPVTEGFGEGAGAEGFLDFGEVFGEATESAEGMAVATEAQATAEELPDLGGLFENSGEDRDREEPATAALEEGAGAEGFLDFGEVFGEATESAEGTAVATEAQTTAEELPDLGGLFENSGEDRDREEPLAVVPEEPVTEGFGEEAGAEGFLDFGEVFGEATESAEGTEVVTEAQATAEELPDLGGLFENSGEDRDREEPATAALEEGVGAEGFLNFGEVFGEATESAEGTEVVTEAQATAEEISGLGGLFENSGEDRDREEPATAALEEGVGAEGFLNFGEVFGEATESAEGTAVATEAQATAEEIPDFASMFEDSGEDGGDPLTLELVAPAIESVTEEAAEVSEFLDIGEVFGEVSESGSEEPVARREAAVDETGSVELADLSEMLGGETSEEGMTPEMEALSGEATLEDIGEEFTEFPDFEAVFGEVGEALAERRTEEPVADVNLENALAESFEQGGPELGEVVSELDFANVLAEMEESIPVESAALASDIRAESLPGIESAEDLAQLEDLFGDGLSDALQEADDALNLGSELENYTAGLGSPADAGGEEVPEEDLGLGELFDGLSDADIVAIADSPEERGRGESSGIDDLENFLAEDGESSPTLAVLSDYFDSGLGEESTEALSTTAADSELDNLEGLENLLASSSDEATSGLDSLDSLLGNTESAPAPAVDDFADLSSLLDSTIGRAGAPSRPVASGDGKKASQRATAMKVKVDVTYLDNLNNLVGELVVNRNLLASDTERMQGFITNLLNQVQLLSEVSQKMRDTFDRSVLETSVIANRPRGFSGFQQMLVVDRSGGGESSSNPHDIRSRFTGDTFDTYNEYHILSQEIIELIVKIKESTSDIEFVVSETDQVTRQLGTITTQVQDNLKQLRMLPFSQLTDRLPRGVRDRALQANKKADIAFEGTDTLIDKAILEQLQDPMVHLVNNAIDHGIEDPETRRQRGKPEVGQLTVRAYHQGNQTVITVSDDGGGIDPEKVKQSAIRKGLLTPAEAAKLSDAEAFNLIFRPGFSTAAVADMYKGRGVGMDVVKSSIEEIRGSILTESEVGKGTTFTIRLPLTLSITKAMACVSNRNKIAFPVDSVEDMLEIPRNQIQLNSKGEPTLPWRDVMLPFLPLSSLLTYNRQISRGSVYGKQDDEILSILVLRNDNNFLALQTDQIIGESEIVIKQLEGPVPQPPGIAGATILGDGRVMAIANVLELFDIASGRLRFKFDVAEPPQEVDEQHDPVVLIVDDSITVRELLSVTFSKVGYRVEQARDGLDAWDKLRSGLPCDLIFCDIEMPKMDGLELLSRVKKDENLKKIPMAMLTSRGADRHRQTARELGANGYFTKPYLEEEVITASKRLLKGERLLDSHS